MIEELFTTTTSPKSNQYLNNPKIMDKREQFKKAVIEAIHGLPHEEALKKEFSFGCLIKGDAGRGVRVEGKVIDKQEDGNGFYADMWECVYDKKCHRTYHQYWSFEKFEQDYRGEVIGLPITIGRVMQAFKSRCKRLAKIINTDYMILFNEGSWKICAIWRLTKDGIELTDDDQTDETIESLLKLL